MSGSNLQQGSTSFAALAALIALAITVQFTQMQQGKASQAIDIAKNNMVKESISLTNLSTISQIKSLLNDKKLSADVYVPGLYPNNYFAVSWDLKKYPSIDTPQITLVGNKSIEVKILDVANKDVNQIKGIFNGGSQLSPSPQANLVKIIKSNFDASGYLVQSVDIEVSGSQVKGANLQSLQTRARIPVKVPRAYNAILEFRLEGTSTWLRSPTQLDSGNYDIRVLGSGVVVEAIVNINGGSDIRLGGFDSATGLPNHKAVNILAKDEIIGQTDHPYSLKSGSAKTNYAIDAAACSMSPVGGKFSVEARLIAADGKTPPDAVSSLDIPVDGAYGQTLSENDIKGICQDQCPYVENQELSADLQAKTGLTGYDANTVGFYRWQQIQANKGTDFSWSHLYDLNTRFKIFDVKFCENLSDPIKNALADVKRTPTFGEVVGHFDSLEYVYFKGPSCKRNFLFERKACGCFAEDTKILLGDQKTWKPIHALTEQDRVWNPISGQAQGINRMTQGPEKVPMLLVKTKRGELVVTGNHPFPTPNGILRAHELESGQLILDGEQNWIEVTQVQIQDSGESPPRVWNLVLEGDNSLQNHYVVANGIVTGDLFIQSMQKQTGTSL